jgi:hypothetical protein
VRPVKIATPAIEMIQSSWLEPRKMFTTDATIRPMRAMNRIPPIFASDCFVTAP